MKVSITGLGKAVPERIVPNSELAPRLGVTPAWIEARTGIQERRYASRNDSASSLGAAAARQALDVSGVQPEDLSMIVVATCTPDYRLPGSASIIQHELGATRAGAFDVGAACSGFIYALAVGSGLVTAGGGGPALIIGVDLLTRHINFDDAMTAPLFGDGAGAVVIQADPEAEPIRFELGSDGSGFHHVLVPTGGSRLSPDGKPYDPKLDVIKMSGREVFRNAVRLMTELAGRFGRESFDLLVAHQANRRILDEAATQLRIDPSKIYMNIQRYGNTSAASIPLALCEAWESGRLRPDDRLLMLAFGAGYTWGGAALRWTLPNPDTEKGGSDPELAHLPA
jgi:3-oxoacyl-[acyl-carrier-protein] synthase III